MREISFPVSKEVVAERAAGRRGQLSVSRHLDQVGRLVVVELVVLQEPELDGGCDDALLEVAPREGEAVVEEVDRVVVPRPVARL